MLRILTVFASLQLVYTNHLIDTFAYYNNPPEVSRFTYDFFKTFNRLMNIKSPPIAPAPTYPGPIYPMIPPPIFPEVPVQKKVFKSIDLRPGSQKVFRVNNGQGIAFRSKNGNAGGMSFSSGNGKGFAFGGTFKGPNNGEFVMSQSSPGSKGKVMYKKGVPDFAKQLFNMFPFGKR